MKTREFVWLWWCAGLVAAMVSLSSGVKADFVAFNDHLAGPGTSNNTTRYLVPGLVGVTGPNGGLLTNISDGAVLPVGLTISTNGAIPTQGNATGNPGVGTPAYNVFHGYVDFGTTNATGNAVQINGAATVTYTFTNLDAGKLYRFHGTAVRGGSGSNYTNRWSVFEIVGAASFTSAHSAGAITSADEPGIITASQVVINTGVNTNGLMAVWDNIVPSNKAFSVTSKRYTNSLPFPFSAISNVPPHAYAISGIRLEEFGGVTTPITIAVQPTNQTVLQCQPVRLHVGATGTTPHYQWFKGTAPISGANGADYTIARTGPSDAGDYHVIVSNAAPSSVNSSTARLVVTPDPALTVVTVLGQTNRLNILMSFSAAIDPASIDQIDPNSNFTVAERADPSATLNITSATVTNGTNILLLTEARAAGVNYNVTINPPGIANACTGRAVTGTFHVVAQVPLLTINATQMWQYLDTGADPGPAWKDPDFDDSSWPQGAAAFDAKRGTNRVSITNAVVRTHLNLTNPSSIFTTNNIATYLFRTHIALAAVPTRLLAATFWDDAGVLFLNGAEAYRLRVPLTNTFAFYSGTQSPANDAIFEGPVDLPTASLVAGDNLIAVELKQYAGTSSDVTMGLELIGLYDTFAPRLSIVGPDLFGDFYLTWSGPGVLQYSASPGGPWADVDNGSAASPYPVTPAAPGDNGFYRLR